MNTDSTPTRRIVLTYKYKLLPSRGQHAKLSGALDHTRQLYNAALSEKIDCYRKTGIGRTFVDQCKGLTELRSDPAWARYAVALQRWPLKKVEQAFLAFFRRVKARDKSVGFPRFKGRDWFKTFGFSDHDGWVLNGARLRMKGIGSIRIHIHRPLPSKPIACTIKRQGLHWYAMLAVEVNCALEHSGHAVGVDVGITALATLSTGEIIPNIKPARRLQKELRRRQRALSRCRRGSNRRRKIKALLNACHTKIGRVRNNHLHHVSAAVAAKFSTIAIENLNIKALARGMLAREIHDVAWGRLNNMLRYKAARAGGEVIEVNARYTSQICSGCGDIVKKDLANRVHSCPDCGLILDRDHNAALNILDRAGNRPGVDNAAGCGKRSLRKTGGAANSDSPCNSPALRLNPTTQGNRSQ